MRYLFYTLFSMALALLLMCCHPKEVKFNRYHNVRYGFEVEYPSFMRMNAAPENGDGFSCQGQGMELVAYGCQNLNYETGALLTFQEVTERFALPTDTFRHAEEGVFEHGGIDETGEVYLERIQMCPDSDDGNILEVVRVSYPQRKSDELEKIAERVIASLVNK